MDLFVSFAWLAVVTWLILRAINQRGLLPRVAIAPPLAAEQAPRIAVVVPARDEAGNICRCLNSLLAQDYPPGRLRVLVVDDHSTDDTAAIVRRMAASHPQLSLLASPPLPPRWTGKSHACWIGARAAAPDSDWLCFVDADVWGEPALLSSAMSAALAQSSTCCRSRRASNCAVLPSGWSCRAALFFCRSPRICGGCSRDPAQALRRPANLC